MHNHVSIHRQHFRGQPWYVLQDRTSGRFLRFSPAAWFVISLLDGERSVEQIWRQARERLGDDALSQDQLIQLLARLYQSDVLASDAEVSLSEALERARRGRRSRWLARVANPLALRVPLFDPERFLNATYPFVRPLLNRWGAAALVLFLSYVGLQAVVVWPELTNNIADRVLATQSLLLLVITYPFVKALHELGHAYAVKRWGGEVHEIGVMLLVLMPVPYVDASASAAFTDKRQRALVGAAGIIVELVLAGIALIVWMNAEVGIVRTFAFNVMLIGGVSTLLFNGNPLLRFDGYYVFSDLLEIPNLGSRSNRFVGYLIQRHLFGLEHAESPATTRSEAPWLFGYAVAAFSYRLFVLTIIVQFVATRFFFIGVLVAFWAVFLMIVLPAIRQLRYLVSDPGLGRHRRRAITVSAATFGFAATVLMLVPVPHSTISEGIVWASEESAIYAQTDGVIVEVLAEPNTFVSAGTALLRIDDELLDARVAISRSRVTELRLRYEHADLENRVDARIFAEQLRLAEADLDLALERQANLLVRSRTDGIFILPEGEDSTGRFVRRGDLLGFATRLEDAVVRVVVDEDAADLVQANTRAVDLRLIRAMAQTVPAEISRRVPQLTDSLPSMALSTFGGGSVAVDPSDPNAVRAFGNLLHLEIAPAAELEVSELGGRAYARFSHPAEPIAFRIYRRLRQVFLRQFSV